MTREQLQALRLLADAMNACHRQGMAFDYYPVGYPNAFGHMEGGPLHSGNDLNKHLDKCYPEKDDEQNDPSIR